MTLTEAGHDFEQEALFDWPFESEWPGWPMVVLNLVVGVPLVCAPLAAALYFSSPELAAAGTVFLVRYADRLDERLRRAYRGLPRKNRTSLSTKWFTYERNRDG